MSCPLPIERTGTRHIHCFDPEEAEIHTSGRIDYIAIIYGGSLGSKLSNHKMRVVLTGLFLLMFGISMNAQTSLLDSLRERERLHTTRDTERVNILYQLAFQQFGSNPEEAEAISNEALDLSTELDWQKGIGNANYLLSIVYMVRGRYDTAIYLGEIAEQHSSVAADDRGLAQSENMIGVCLHKLGIFDEAIQYYQQSLSRFESLGDSSAMGSVLVNLGAIYDQTGEPEKCLEYLEEAKHLMLATGNDRGLSGVYNNIGGSLLNLGKYQQAREQVQLAIDLKTELGEEFGMVAAFIHIGTSYLEEGNESEALTWFRKALSQAYKRGLRGDVANASLKMGSTYYRLGKMSPNPGKPTFQCHQVFTWRNNSHLGRLPDQLPP